MIFWSAKKTRCKDFFHLPFPFHSIFFANATVLAFVLLCNSRFNIHCDIQREAMPTQKSAQKWRYNLSRLLAWKITKSIHLCKPASLNCPVLQMPTSADSKTNCVTLSSPATHQTLQQQGGTREDGHAHLSDWTLSVVAIEKKTVIFFKGK